MTDALAGCRAVESSHADGLLVLDTDEEHDDAWHETAKILKTYSDEIVDRWIKEIDTLLVYVCRVSFAVNRSVEQPLQAGLFSAILTAFNVQSYQLLAPPPPADPVIVALERISAQLSGFSVYPPFINSTQPAFIYRESMPPASPRWAV